MPINIYKILKNKIIDLFTAISGNYPDIAVIANGIGIFYE